MSIKQMVTVWEYEFDHPEQSVMMALADHAHEDGTEIRPSVRRLAWKTGYEERQVQRILKRLRDDLGILVLVRKGGGRGNPSVYKFDWSKGVKKSPFESVKGDIETVKGDISTQKGDIAKTPEPSLEPSSIEPPPPEDAVASRNWFTVLCDKFKEYDLTMSDTDRNRYPGNLNRLASLEADDMMFRIISRIADRRKESGYVLSPQEARDDIRSDNGPRRNGSKQGTGKTLPVNTGGHSDEEKGRRTEGYEWLFGETSEPLSEEEQAKIAEVERKYAEAE